MTITKLTAAADALAEDAAANEGMWTRDDASFVVVGASPKAKTMKEVLLRCGRGLAVAVVIALAGKGFVGHAHNDPQVSGVGGKIATTDHDH
eukprot:scaffold46889_cov131-Skeletonema_marinoi.AAC.1